MNSGIWRREYRRITKCLLKVQSKAAVTSLKLANSCWQTQVGVCERHKNSRQNTFLFDANSLQTCLPSVFVPFTHTNLGLPTRVCQLEFAVWRPLKTKENRSFFSCRCFSTPSRRELFCSVTQHNSYQRQVHVSLATGTFSCKLLWAFWKA